MDETKRCGDCECFKSVGDGFECTFLHRIVVSNLPCQLEVVESMKEREQKYEGEECTAKVEVSVMINKEICGTGCVYLLDNVEGLTDDFCALFCAKLEVSHKIDFDEFYYRCEKCKQTFRKENKNGRISRKNNNPN